jgi:hypothetical protein
MFLDFVHRLMISKNTFRKLDLFPFSGKIMAVANLLGPLFTGPVIEANKTAELYRK